jgi:lipid A ethanolaminephosphotransferase
MKNPIQLFYNHITIAKVICLALLFSPLWGLWWFNIDSEVDWLLQLLYLYFYISIRAGVVYLSVCILAFVSFVVVPFIRTSIVRVPMMLIMLAGWAFELSILDLNGTLSGQNLFGILWQERATALEAVDGYGCDIIRDCVCVAVLGMVLCASPARRFSLSGKVGLMPLLSGAMVASLILYTKGATQAFPIPFGTFSNAAIVLVRGWDGAFDPVPSRDIAINEMKIDGEVHPIFNKIVMIMDESVRGDYLSLNDATRDTTPYLQATKHLVNFGVASSGGNCSIISRVMFRFGMRQSDLPNGWQQGLSRPTFWEFAHRAGYKTVHIDAWYGSMSLGNGFSLTEKTLIDSNISIIKNPSYLRDQVLAENLIHALKDEAPAFIYAEKFGVHFPYSNKYPPNFRGRPTNLVSGADASVDAVGERELADYPNALDWSVDEFFRSLLPAVDLSKTLIVYTSDHGQNLLPGHITHCTTSRVVPRGEEYVPLLAITSVPEFEQRLAKRAARSFGLFSHFEVFPTLLLAMGYDADWVNRTYGPSLMDVPSPERKFMIGSPGLQAMMISVDRNFRPAASSIEPQQAQMPKAGLN